VEFLAYADDLALIGKNKYIYELEIMLSAGMNFVRTWLANNGLELAVEKFKAIILTNTRVHNDFIIEIDGIRINSTRSIKYLSTHFNSKLSFIEYGNHVAIKAGQVANNLVRKLPNISAAKPKKRRLLANVVHSIILYGAPIWASAMSQKGKSELAKVQTLRVESAYHTISATL